MVFRKNGRNYDSEMLRDLPEVTELQEAGFTLGTRLSEAQIAAAFPGAFAGGSDVQKFLDSSEEGSPFFSPEGLH